VRISVRTKRSKEKGEKKFSDVNNPEAENDPTFLSEAYMQYRSTVESLVDGSFPYELLLSQTSEDEISRFRALNGEGAFRCRLVGCEKGWTGFDIARERNLHERTHGQRFRCLEAGCLVEFPSREALRRHRRQYHVKEGQWIVRWKRGPDGDPTHQLAGTSSVQASAEARPDYTKPWYMASNREAICYHATTLAAEATKVELTGILERMSPTLKEELAVEEINPLEYHFRTIAVREFCRKQGRPMRLLKNTSMISRLEDEASDDIDTSLAAVLEPILTNPAVDPISAQSWDDDVGNLWK